MYQWTTQKFCNESRATGRPLTTLQQDKSGPPTDVQQMFFISRKENTGIMTHDTAVTSEADRIPRNKYRGNTQFSFEFRISILFPKGIFIVTSFYFILLI